jgi:hypothetical protein
MALRPPIAAAADVALVVQLTPLITAREWLVSRWMGAMAITGVFIATRLDAAARTAREPMPSITAW